MNTSRTYKWLAALAIVGLGTACETDDVDDLTATEPTVALSATQTTISEDGGSAEVTATLTETISDNVTVNITVGGTATGNGEDYSLVSTSISIPAGAISGSVTVSTVQDTDEEGNETIVISMESVSGAAFDATQSLTVIIEDDDVPLSAQLIINEVLYDPSNSGLDGDANGDGSYAQNEDEFIEFANLSSQSIDISGYKIFDAESLDAGTPNHTFPANTVIASGKAIVVFGGGTPTGSFGGATVQTSTSGDFNLNNSGDKITLQDADGNSVLTFDIEPLSNNPNESYTRSPDLTGAFEQHSENTSLLFSPGTKIDGSAF